MTGKRPTFWKREEFFPHEHWGAEVWYIRTNARGQTVVTIIDKPTGEIHTIKLSPPRAIRRNVVAVRMYRRKHARRTG